MRTKVKICGVKSVEEIKILNSFEVDYIGFIFTKSKREINIQRAKELKSYCDNQKILNIVGVFKNNSIEEIKEVLNSKVINCIQLHGSETVEFIKELKKYTNLPIIKAFHEENCDIEKYNNFVDFFLFDGKNAGSGERFDWNKIPKVKKKIFLAGGICKDNVKEAIDKINPYALDLSSSLEVEGIKSYEKIKEFLDEVKRSDKIS